MLFDKRTTDLTAGRQTGTFGDEDRIVVQDVVRSRQDGGEESCKKVEER